ncbi:MAG: hypothetical protein AB8B80_13250 [Marinicellaceae bacterium]
MNRIIKMFKFTYLLTLLISANVMSQSLINNSILTIEASLFENASFQGIWNIKITEFPDASGANLEFSTSTGLGVDFSGSSIIQKNLFH